MDDSDIGVKIDDRRDNLDIAGARKRLVFSIEHVRRNRIQIGVIMVPKVCQFLSLLKRPPLLVAFKHCAELRGLVQCQQIIVII